MKAHQCQSFKGVLLGKPLHCVYVQCVANELLLHVALPRRCTKPIRQNKGRYNERAFSDLMTASMGCFVPGKRPSQTIFNVNYGTGYTCESWITWLHVSTENNPILHIVMPKSIKLSIEQDMFCTHSESPLDMFQGKASDTIRLNVVVDTNTTNKYTTQTHIMCGVYFSS